MNGSVQEKECTNTVYEYKINIIRVHIILPLRQYNYMRDSYVSIEFKTFIIVDHTRTRLGELQNK